MTIGYVGKPYKEFISWLSEQGHSIVAFADKSEAVAYPAQVKQIVALSFESKESVFLDLEKSNVQIDAVVAIYENAVLIKSWISEWYGLPGPSETVANIATDKYLMRQAFKKHCPDFSPEFLKVSSWEAIEQFTQTHSFPLILKPTNLFKSLYVTKNNTLEELRRSFDETIKGLTAIYKKEHVYRAPELVIEEFLEGPSFSVEVFADKEGNLASVPSPADLIMGRDLGINDNFNFSRSLPSVLSPDKQKSLIEAAEAAAKAVGLVSSPAHVELILTSKGPKIIELGARTGGYRSKMYQLAFGIDLFAAQLKVAEGKLPALEAKYRQYCAVYEIFSLASGKYQGVENLEELQKFPACHYVSEKRKPGDAVGLSKDGFRAAVVVILLSKNLEEIQKADTFLRNNVVVVTQVN